MAALERMNNLNREGLDQDPFWYKTGVIYEVHVRAFCDSDGNGVGDFRGLTGKLDYLKDLGVTALWLLPFYPSPLRDDGYDIANYCDHLWHTPRTSSPSLAKLTSEACASSSS